MKNSKLHLQTRKRQALPSVAAGRFTSMIIIMMVIISMSYNKIHAQFFEYENSIMGKVIIADSDNVNTDEDIVFGFNSGQINGNNWLEGMRIQDNTGRVGIGVTNPQDKLHIGNGDLRLDSNHEIFFGDNGQIRSHDDAHRILFRRGENIMELREYGNIVFSSGAISGSETSTMVLANNGNVGIGITSPAARLDIGQGNGLLFRIQPDNGNSAYMGRSLDNALQFDWGYGNALNSTANLTFTIDADNVDNDIRYIDFKKHTYGFLGGDILMRIQENGHVGIGTSTPSEQLEVVGNIKADGVILNIGSFPDYVFEKDYPLMPLSKVETYIKANKHLPGFPSEAEVIKTGANLGQLNNLLVEKVEELTLYTIAQEKQIDKLSDELEFLKAKLNELLKKQ